MGTDQPATPSILQVDFGLELRAMRKEANESQLDVAEAIGRSHSYISKLETGAADPDVTDLKMLTEYFSLNGDAEERLSSAFRRTISNHRIESHVLDEAETIIATARSVRLLGRPQIGWDLASRSATRLYRSAMVSRLDHAAEVQVERLLNQMLYEAIKCKLDFDLAGASTDGGLAWAAQLQRDLGFRAVNHDDRLRALLAVEAVLYATGDNDDARRVTDEAAGLDQAASPELRTELMRAVAINCFDGEADSSYALATSLADRATDESSIDDASFLLEGVARIPVRDEGLRHTAIGQLREHLESNETDLNATRRSQATRTVLRQSGTTHQLDADIMAIARRTKSVAATNGLDRYVSEIEDLINLEN